MKNKILFIQPPLSCNKNVKFLNHEVPLGFLYMGSILETNNFEVKILDCQLDYKKRRKIDEDAVKIGLYSEDIKEYIEKYNPDIIGVSCSFSMFEADSFELINLIKEINKEAIIVVGGAHASTNPEYVLRNKNIDIVVIGEGELTILEIAQKLKENKSLDNIKGTAIRQNNKIYINPSREPIKDLDSLEPAWHLIDLKEYFKHPDNHAITIRSPSVHIITSRGCPGNCTFCSVQTVWGRSWRAISAKRVVDQIEYLKKSYGVKHFRINDDNITLNKERIIEICEEIIKRKLYIKWDTPSGVALWTLDKNIINLMKDSGYYRITFALESGSKNTLKYIGKYVNLEKAKDLIDYSNKIGLWTASFFIIGFPTEKKEDIEATFKFILESKINFPFLFVAQPYPGTKMSEDFKKWGLIENGLLETSTFIKTKYNSKYFTAGELNRMRADLYKQFYKERFFRYCNPIKFYQEFGRKIKSIEDIIYVCKILKNLITAFLY